MRSLINLIDTELGERTLPSTTTLPVPAPTLQPAVVTSISHPFHGTGSGNYKGPGINVDSGVNFSFKGTARLDHYGTFQMSGNLTGVGYILQGRASGQIVLSNAHGSITLDLHGPIQRRCPGNSCIRSARGPEILPNSKDTAS